MARHPYCPQWPNTMWGINVAWIELQEISAPARHLVARLLISSFQTNTVSSWFNPQIHIYLVFFGKKSQDGTNA